MTFLFLQMSVGQRAKLICPHNVAFGEKGHPGVYPFHSISTHSGDIFHVANFHMCIQYFHNGCFKHNFISQIVNSLATLFLLRIHMDCH